MSNQGGPPVRCVLPLESMQGISTEDGELLKSMAKDAESFLHSFPWCRSVERRYFGAGIGGVIGIFLFEIVPATTDVDRWIWVIVGDLPPAYLVTSECKTPSETLRGYIYEMRRWVDLAEKGHTSPDVIPVNVPATPESARELGRRLEYLQVNVLPFFREAEIERA